MQRGFAILFVALPLTEILLFVIVGTRIGALATVGLVILAAIAGGLILRRRGLAAAQGLRRPLSGLMPVAEEALIVVAALLLILPGFLTDALALLLLVPPVRRMLIALVAARVAVQAGGMRGSGADDVIEAEYVDLDAPPPDPDGGRPVGRSGWTRH